MIKITRCLLPLLLTTFSYTSFAQAEPKDFSYTWGDADQGTSGFIYLGYQGNDKDGYLRLNYNKRGSVMLTHYDRQLHKDARNELDVPDVSKEFEVLRFYHVTDKYYFLYSTWDKSAGQEKLFVQEIDCKTAQFKGAARLLQTSNAKIVLNYEAVNSWVFADLPQKWWSFISRDSSKIMVQYRVQPGNTNDKTNSDQIGFAVFDNTFNKLWAKEFIMPYNEDQMDNQDYLVDEKGAVYILARVFPNGGGKKSPNFRFEVLKYAQGSETPEKIPFSLNGKSANSAKLEETTDGNVVVTGFYSGTGGRRVEGYYLFGVNGPANAAAGTILHEFPKPASEGSGDATNMELHKIFTNPDGKIVLVAEQTNSRSSYSTFSNTQSYAEHMICNDILVIQVGKDGAPDWTVKIPKKQKNKEIGIGTISFKYVYHNQSHFLFFMNDEKNLSAPQGSRFYNSGEPGVLECVKLDASGNPAAPQIINSPGKEGMSVVTNFITLGDGKMYMGSWDGKTSTMGLVSFH